MKRINQIFFRLVIIVIVLGIWGGGYAQGSLLKKWPFGYLEYQLQASLIKNLTLYKIKNSLDVEDNRLGFQEFIFENPDGHQVGGGNFPFYGFGFQPSQVRFHVKQVNEQIDCDSLMLFELFFDPEFEENKTTLMWLNSLPSGSFFGPIPSRSPKYLLAVDGRHRVLFVSGLFIFRNEIAKYFDLDAQVPNSYISFLKAKLYNQIEGEISFSKREGDYLFFVATKKGVYGQNVDFELRLDTKRPEYSIEEIRILNSEKVENGTRIRTVRYPKPVPRFIDLQDKESYLFNSLMRNIYVHRISTLKDLGNTIGLNSEASYFIPNQVSIMDSLLPNYDEVIQGMEIEKFACCSEISLDRCYQDKMQHLQFPIFYEKYTKNQGLTYDKRIVVGFEKFNEIEVYRVRRPIKEIIERRLNTDNQIINIDQWNVHTTSWTRQDHYWNPEQKENEFPPGWSKPWPPPPAPPKRPTFRSFDPSSGEEIALEPQEDCYIYHRDTLYRKPHVAYPEYIYHDYYLVALDRNTREVFFISGLDILLSRVLNLYAPGEFSKEELLIPFSDWPTQYQLTYIRDRLFSYQVSEVNEDHLVTKDDEKMVFELKGVIKDYGRVLLEVTVFLDRAEVVHTKVLSYLNYD